MEQRRSGDAELRGPKLRVTRTTAPDGFRLIGVIDHNNVEEFGRWLQVTLQALNGSGGDVHLNLGSVEFADTTGIRQVVDSARDLDGSGRLILHELPDRLRATIRAVGWTDLPSLVIADRRRADG